jgi:hypothetical protein
MKTFIFSLILIGAAALLLAVQKQAEAQGFIFETSHDGIVNKAKKEGELRSGSERLQAYDREVQEEVSVDRFGDAGNYRNRRSSTVCYGIENRRHGRLRCRPRVHGFLSGVPALCKKVRYFRDGAKPCAEDSAANGRSYRRGQSSGPMGGFSQAEFKGRKFVADIRSHLFIEQQASPEGQNIVDKYEPLVGSIYWPGSDLARTLGGKKLCLNGFDTFHQSNKWMAIAVEALGFPKPRRNAGRLLKARCSRIGEISPFMSNADFSAIFGAIFGG